MRRAQGQGAEAFLAVQLTPRAIDILWGIAKGFRYADVADHLGISRQTVPCHIKNIYRKLEVHTRGEPSFYRYEGSLTKPPCSETVGWSIFDSTIEVAEADVQTFRALYPMNARPPQATNRRFLFKGL